MVYFQNNLTYDSESILKSLLYELSTFVFGMVIFRYYASLVPFSLANCQEYKLLNQKVEIGVVRNYGYYVSMGKRFLMVLMLIR